MGQFCNEKFRQNFSHQLALSCSKNMTLFYDGGIFRIENFKNRIFFLKSTKKKKKITYSPYF